MKKNKLLKYILGLGFLAVCILVGIYYLNNKTQTSLLFVEFIKKEETPDLKSLETNSTKASLPLDKSQWQELQEIISSKNDNDPRLDQDFKIMSKELHQLLIQRYSEIPEEDRNQRGLIVFLISRDLKDLDDFKFLKTVFKENPCLSLNNCNVLGLSDPHHSGIDQSSLNYPQLTALYQLEKQLTANSQFLENSKMKVEALSVVAQASQFPVPLVQKKALAILDGVK